MRNLHMKRLSVLGKLAHVNHATSVTYKQAQAAIMDALQSEGWTVSRHDSRTFKALKIPHATSSNGKHRLWFKAQAIYYGSPRAGFGEARSMWLGDIRGMSTQTILNEIGRQIVATDRP